MKPQRPLTITGGRLVLPNGLRPGAIRCIDGRIVAVGDVTPQDGDEIEHRGVLEQPVHHAAVADPAPPGGDCPGAGIAHQRQLGELRALEPDGRGGERVDP